MSLPVTCPLALSFLRLSSLFEREGLFHMQVETSLGTKSSHFGKDQLRMSRRSVTKLRTVLGS